MRRKTITRKKKLEAALTSRGFKKIALDRQKRGEYMERWKHLDHKHSFWIGRNGSLKEHTRERALDFVSTCHYLRSLLLAEGEALLS